MLEVLQKIIASLLTNATLVALLTTKKSNGTSSVNLFTGAVDVAMEKQADLLYPSVVVSVISEVSRTVPTGARDGQVQISIFSRNSQLEVENIYEQILTTLNYLSGNQSTAHIFWERLDGAVDLFEADRRVWHRALTLRVWVMKP